MTMSIASELPAFKDHCSLFPMSMRVIEAHGGELKPYYTGKGRISLPRRQTPPRRTRDEARQGADRGGRSTQTSLRRGDRALPT